MKIIASLADPRYSIRYRDIIVKASMWEWGLDEKLNLYYRDLASITYINDWNRVIDQIYIDRDTLNTLAWWYKMVNKGIEHRE